MTAPISWRRQRLRFAFDEIDVRVGTEDTDLPLLSVSIHHGVRLRSEMTDREARADAFTNYKVVEPRDVVINRMRAFEGGVGVSAYKGMVSSDYAVLRPRSGVDARFLHHLLRSAWFVGEMTARLRGIGSVDQGNVRTPRINVEDLGNIVVALPPLDDQQRLAAQLEAETTRVEQLVAATRAQASAIRERFRASCDEVLADRVEGTSPLVRLRFVAAVNPVSPAFDRLRDQDEVTFMPLETVWPHGRADVSRTRPWAEVRTGFTRFMEGDVVVPKITPTFQAGRSTRVVGLRNGLGTGTTELHVVRPTPGLDGRYLAHLLNGRSFLAAGEAAMYGVAGQQRVPDSIVRDFRIPVPDLGEQQRMADHLDRLAATVDRLVERLDGRVRLLNDRRQALANAVVTGEISALEAAA